MTVKPRLILPAALLSTCIAGGCNDTTPIEEPANANQKVASAPLNPGATQETAKAQTQAAAPPKETLITVNPEDAKNFGPYDKAAIPILTEHAEPHVEPEVKQALNNAIKARKEIMGLSEGNKFKKFTTEEQTELKAISGIFENNDLFSPMKAYVNSKEFTWNKQIDRELAVHLTAIASMNTMYSFYDSKMTLFKDAIKQKAASPEEKAGKNRNEAQLWERLNITKGQRFEGQYVKNFSEWLGRNQKDFKIAN